MKLTDEQMIEALKEAGHQEAATTLEQKVNAQAAASGDDPPEGGEPSRTTSEERPVPPGPGRIARGYAAREQGAKAGEGE